MECIAAFEALLVTATEKLPIATSEMMLTTVPPPFARSMGLNACVSASGPNTFTSILSRAALRSIAPNSEPNSSAIPALLSSRDTSVASRAAAAMCAAFRTSSAIGTITAPCWLVSGARDFWQRPAAHTFDVP